MLSPQLDINSPTGRLTLINTINALLAGKVNTLEFEPQVSAPPIKEGVVAYADGVKWNPGSGEGLYIYQTNKWWKLFY